MGKSKVGRSVRSNREEKEMEVEELWYKTINKIDYSLEHTSLQASFTTFHQRQSMDYLLEVL